MNGASAPVGSLRVTHVSKSFGGVRAIDDLSFDVRQGIVHSIIGPNGAGKTTLVNLLTGVYRPASGRIAFDGRVAEGASGTGCCAKASGSERASKRAARRVVFIRVSP